MCELVVSLIGSTCTARIPTLAAQRTMCVKSVKSPTPQLRSLRSENTGITTPASRGSSPPGPAHRSSRRTGPAATSTRRLSRFSQTGEPSGRIRTYLYSTHPAEAGTDTSVYQRLSPKGLRRRTPPGFQSPNSATEPSRPQASPTGRSGADKQNCTPTSGGRASSVARPGRRSSTPGTRPSAQLSASRNEPSPPGRVAAWLTPRSKTTTAPSRMTP